MGDKKGNQYRLGAHFLKEIFNAGLRTAKWAVEKLGEDYEKPFFLAAGCCSTP